MGGAQGRQAGHHDVFGQQPAQREPQQTRDGRAAWREAGLQRTALGQHALRVFEEQLALVGERQAMGAAVRQPQPTGGLDAPQRARDIAAGQATLSRDLGQRTRRRDPVEQLEVLEAQLVHACACHAQAL